MNRRKFIRKLGAVSAFASVPALRGEALPSPTQAEQEAMSSIATAFLKEHAIPGLSVAFGVAGDALFQRAFGHADLEAGEMATPAHRFRIASVSKPITAVAILRCVENGLLSLDAPVFGPRGLLSGFDGDGLQGITVDHLLTHASGGWPNDGADPMFRHPNLGHAELIARTIAGQKPARPPGTHYAYSNFGYCLLGRVLEHVTKKPYAEFVAREILAGAGITSMAIGGNTLADRQPDEVRYYTDPVARAYGMNVARMDAHGGWIATASDLVRFASRLPRVLGEKSIRIMTSGGINPSYARGWAVNEVPNWWHTGSLPGTTAILVHTRRGICWAGLTNARRDGADLDSLMWKLARSVKAWGL
jgi:CubicO group peptidase (beta-lactamase class C family)